MPEFEREQKMMAGDTDGEVATKAVEDVSSVGADSQPLNAGDVAEMKAAITWIELDWPQDSKTSDCRIMDRKVTFFSDGRARFQARVRSRDTGDCWVYFGGVGIKDRNEHELWRSGKLVGPGMPESNLDYFWDQWFTYPALWYPYINKAVLYDGHC